MKKKLFWIFVPLALVLSSCGHYSKAPSNIDNNHITPTNTFIEDTFLHEEMFKNVNELKVRKSFTPLENSDPRIGVQTKLDNHGTVDEDDDTISVRFVAAVAINGDLASATAVWTRAMFDTSGNAFKAVTPVACTTAYNALATAGDPYTIEDYNNACNGSYTHFVAYTMRNIPLSDYSNYYFTAFLTLNDSSGQTVSKVVATTVDQTTQFSFNNSETGYFAIKKTDNGFETIEKTGFDNSGHYYADFEGMSFTATDSFLIVNRENNHFQVFGYDAAHAVDPLDTEFTQLGSSQFLDCRYERSYFIHLNEYNRISVEEAFAKTFYFKPNNNWNDGGSKYIITLKHNDEYVARVYEMNRIGETNTYQCDCFYTTSMASAPIAFYKLPSGDSLDLNGKPHSQNLGWPLSNDDMFTMNKGNDKGYWSLRTEADPVIETGNFTITDFTEAVEIHTDRQKEYLAYTGKYTEMLTSEYPDGNQHISDSLPVEVDFDFSVPGGKEIDHYSVIFGKEPDLSDGYEKVGDAETDINFYNPYLGKNYYKLVAHFTDSTSEESAIHNFYVDATCPRNLTISGMTNCRDMGGRLLEDGGVFKQGLIYRTSGSGQGSWNPNVAYEEMVNHLGFKNEIYVADRGTGYACNLQGVPVQNFYMDYQANGYNSNFSRNTEPIKKFFNFLADSNNYPVFFHCRIGTDRTGVCAILLNGLLGVPLNEIYQDYLFSNFGNINGKRYIGEQAGNDNILRYTEYLQNFSGETFKNKVYNALLSIGLSGATLDAVINNLTDGPRAQGNDAGQVVAFGDHLTAHGVEMSTYDNSDYSNHPTQYYALTGPSESVSYTFNTPVAYEGQIVAYIANGDPSSSTKLDHSLGLSLDDVGLSIRDVSFQEAGMGSITKSGAANQRWMYYPVILGIAEISAGEHTIEINGREGQMNIGGITILNASTAVDLGGGALSGEDPKHVHNFDTLTSYTPATCEHSGERVYQCSCGRTQTEVLQKLSHEWDGPIVSNAAGTSGLDAYPATTGYNCSLCNKGALRWSAMDYDASSSEIEDNGSYIRMNSAQQANANNDGVTGGGHLIYKINVPEDVEHASLSFYIQAHTANVAIFDYVAGDSGGGMDFVNDQVVTPTKRYALYVNNVRIELGTDPGPSTATKWFDWPVDFSLHEGVNTIEIVSMGGYRAKMYEFQLTGFTAFVSNHEHELGSWQHDDYAHWKECIADGCPNGEHYHFDEDYHTFGADHVLVEPTCSSTGSGERTCTVCGYTENFVIPTTPHNYEEEITEQPTCTTDGTKTYTCSECGHSYTETIPAAHTWVADGEPVVATDGTQYQTFECSVCHAKKIEIAATSGAFANGSSIKSGTPSGYLKLNSNGNSISYTFDVDLGENPSATATLYQRGFIDFYSSNTNKYIYTGGKTTPGTYSPDCEIRFNGSESIVDLSSYQNQTFYNVFGGNSSASNSPEKDVESGTVTLVNGTNTFSYKRAASYNLVISHFVLIIEP